MPSCKDDCEALMSDVLPVAEQRLTEQGALQPFGSTMSSAGQIVRIGGDGARTSASNAELIASFEASFRDGAARGEIRASALVLANSDDVSQQAVTVRLDHVESYSLVVTFPFHFSPAGAIVIEEPFASPGEHRIFE